MVIKVGLSGPVTCRPCGVVVAVLQRCDGMR